MVALILKLFYKENVKYSKQRLDLLIGTLVYLSRWFGSQGRRNIALGLFRGFLETQRLGKENAGQKNGGGMQVTHEVLMPKAAILTSPVVSLLSGWVIGSEMMVNTIAFRQQATNDQISQI
ncbi:MULTISPECIES: hypothetical protein [unclassified Coleofasciculus]|uniref:hypothetical protein n=1 Tax=unclassified Coleofasciculus TaxID=2692782 RepID=UPI001880F3BC|nr:MULTISPECIES: hypothetical protein [unclassified Coleofasciculus]MBE9128696.1 hypothetical protein [Coleofasciculus sp. LEGE 07081]MBE9151482.1 hypothetical protein [Coleofasciculus sp. LEGE 07092]